MFVHKTAYSLAIHSTFLVILAFALLGRAAPALSTPLFFMGLLGAYAHKPIKKAGRPVPRLMRELKDRASYNK